MCALTFPLNSKTVLAAVAADLLEGRRPSGKTCWLEHGSSRLSHHIWALNKDGWPIHFEDILVHTSDGRKAVIREYYLPPEVIAAQGERGDTFVHAVRKARNELRKQAA